MSKSFKGISQETKQALKKAVKSQRDNRKTKNVRWIPSTN